VDDPWGLRKILSQNIKTIRGYLHISQAKLAEYADISLSYLTDIERCRTWVSDKTLQNLAHALNREAWELLLPGNEENSISSTPESLCKQRDQRIAALIAKKRETLGHTVDKVMEELVLEIIRKE
jgi:transcriptional regulator with XRE-family HTH domain